MQHDVRVRPSLKDGAWELWKEDSELFDCIPNLRCTSILERRPFLQRRRWLLGGSACQPKEKDYGGIVAFRAEEFCFVHQRLRVLDTPASLTAIRLISNKYFHSSQIALYSLTKCYSGFLSSGAYSVPMANCY